MIPCSSCIECPSRHVMWQCQLKPSLHSITQLRRQWQNTIVEMWNACYPVGTEVSYWLEFKEAEQRVSKTSTPAEITECLIPVINVEGYPYSLMLQHVAPLEVAKQIPKKPSGRHEHVLKYARAKATK